MYTELRDRLHEEWGEITTSAAIAWTVFYCLFLWQAANRSILFLLLENVNLVIHEAGHLLFGYLGQTFGVCGGTFLQLFVPAALAFHFALRRDASGFAFCLFFSFENLLGIAAYMADARSLNLPLVSVSGGQNVLHDWFYLFSKLGILQLDTTVAMVARTIGWAGMIGTMLWLGYLRWRAGFDVNGKGRLAGKPENASQQ